MFCFSDSIPNNQTPMTSIVSGCLPAVRVYVFHLYVTLAGVFVAEMWTASNTRLSDKLAIQEIFRYTTVSHPMNMAEPSHTSMA